jgi:hypothetical protein
MRKIIISDALKEVLLKVNNPLSQILLDGKYFMGDADKSHFLETEKWIDYLDLSHNDKGHLSYLTKERIEKIQNSEEKDFWKVGMRYHGRSGSVIKKLFSKGLSHHFEDFSMKYVAVVDKPAFEMKLVKGDDIAKYYHNSSYKNIRGNLGMSCMARSPKEYFDIYTKNPDKVNMLIMLTEDDKIMGRAIVWIGEDFKVMDRIYVTNDIYTEYFVEWCTENNVYYKEQNNYRTPKHMIDPVTKEKCFKEFSIELETNFERYPYIDSFKWINKLENKIYNHIPKDCVIQELNVLCDSMGGSLRGDTYKFDDEDNSIYGYNEVHFLDYLNLNLHSYKLRYSNSLSKWIKREHSIRLEEFDDYIFNEEYNHLNDNEKIEDWKAKIIEDRKKPRVSKSWDDVVWSNSEFRYGGTGYQVYTATLTIDENARVEHENWVEQNSIEIQPEQL